MCAAACFHCFQLQLQHFYILLNLAAEKANQERVSILLGGEQGLVSLEITLIFLPI